MESEGVKIFYGIKSGERRKTRVNGTGKAGEKIWKKFHAVFIMRQQRFRVVRSVEEREIFIVGRFLKNQQHIQISRRMFRRRRRLEHRVFVQFFRRQHKFIFIQQGIVQGGEQRAARQQ